MKNGQKKDDAEERTEAKTPVRLKEDPSIPKRNKRGAIDRFARRIEEVGQVEKVPARSR